MANGERGIEALKPSRVPQRPSTARKPVPRKRTPAAKTRAPRRAPAVGILALLLGIGAVVVVVVGINSATAGDYATATTLAYAAIAASISGFLIGGVAAITARGRGLGVLAMAICVPANPVVLMHILDYTSRFYPG